MRRSKRHVQTNQKIDIEHTLVVEVEFGSILYGTSTPDSDVDIRGIVLPTKQEILLGKIPKVVTTPKSEFDDELDVEYYSLHHFIWMACRGEVVALDMLHVPNENLVKSSKVWKDLVSKRDMFYTKSMKAITGYLKKQSATHSIRSSRLKEVKCVVSILKKQRSLGHVRLNEIWHLLPQGEHIKKYPPASNGVREVEVCGRKVQDTVTIDYALNVFETYINNFGKRVRAVESGDGVDWKAVSHAMRAAFQIKEILTSGTITFPLPQADYLLDIKEGRLSFVDDVAPALEELTSEIEILSKISGLPEKVDKHYWDAWLCDVLEAELFNGKQKKQG